MSDDTWRVGLTIVGTVVGSYFGYPQLGALVGGMVGSALFPGQLPTQRGPKLDDLTVQGSAIGIPIPLTWGSFRVAGNIIWATDLIATETSEEVGGKGGGPQQTIEQTTYAVNFAVGLVNNEITGVRRIWAGGKLIYDRRPQLPGESLQDFDNRQAAADQLDSFMTVYTGTETQLPDPLIESFLGIGNVPAYRSLAYVVFRDFQLADFGNNLAATALSFEVISGGAISFSEVTTYAPYYVVPHLGSSFDPFSPDNDHSITATIRRTWPFGDGAGVPSNEWANSGVQNSQTSAINGLINSLQLDSLGHAIAPAWPAYHILTTFCSRNRQTSSATQYSSLFDPTSAETEGAHRITIFYSPFAEVDLFDTYRQVDIPGGSVADKLLHLRTVVGVPDGAVVYIESAFDADFDFSFGGIVTDCPGALYMWTDGTPLPAEVWDWHAAAGGASNLEMTFDGGKNWLSAQLIGLSGIRVAREPDPLCQPRVPPHVTPPAAPFPGFCTIDGSYYEDIAWQGPLPNDETQIRILQVYDQRPDWRDQVGPLLHVSSPNFTNQPFWEARYLEAVAAGTMPSGLSYDATGFGGDYPNVTDYWRLVADQSVISANEVTLDIVVGDLCARAGLLPDQYDVADLTQVIPGYGLGRVMDAASAIQPLRPFGFFDMVESNAVLKFVPRGGAAVATLEADDLGAHAVDSDRPPGVEITRMQDVHLPRGLRLKYLMLDKDYEPGEQVASRLRTTADQIIDVEMPIALTDVMAAQIADVSLYEAWIGRNTYNFALSQTFLALEPTDPVMLPIDDSLERVRILSEDFSIPGVKQIQAIRDGGLDAYFSYAAGGSPLVPEQTIRVLDDTVAVYLDLPLLRDADSDPGYYIALRQASNNGTWPGARVLRSPDGGATYLAIASASAQSVTGVMNFGLTDPAAQTTVVDFTDAIEVTLDRLAFTLESVSMASLLVGANAAAIGVHGRWEIIQFMNAELTDATDGNTWRLTGLLRGRRGTEWTIGLSEVGDTFVLLRNVVRATQEIASIGATRFIKALTFGQPADAELPVVFTGNGMALEPFSPVWVEGARDGGDNLTVTWIRRSRFGQEMPGGGVAIPLGEVTEAYEVEFLDGTAVVRTVAVSVTECEYTAAEQTADFGSPQALVSVRIYQMSAVVGRGTPAEAEV